MLRITDLRLPLDHPADALRTAVARRLGVAEADLTALTVFKRAIDARKPRALLYVYTVDCALDGEAAVLRRLKGDRRVGPAPDTRYVPLGRAGTDFYAAADAPPRPIVVGFGPCGIFCALVLAQMGLRPIVLERGKRVRERTQDTWGLWRGGVLDPESNVQFGEGGAGTFSDGKLYSQISDPRHLTRKVLSEFVTAGAPEDILYDGKPHIGTFRLVSVVEKMRAAIERLGGEIRFEQRVTDVRIEGDHIRGVTLAGGEEVRADHVVLALGHSARDTFSMLHARGVAMAAKPFAVGYRIEHPQSVIDRARFGPNAGNPLLGPADYRLVHHAANGRAVYSFCMCPGGTVVAATSEAERVVTNGMSQRSRAERNANAGIVVGIAPADYAADPNAPGPVSPLDGIAFQRRLEARAFELGGGGYVAPGQRVGDFLAGRPSGAFGDVVPSYTPGVRPTDLDERGNESLPDYAVAAIREALPAFDARLAGFAMSDAVLTGVETRTSSPLRMPRGADYQSVNVKGLYPAGEGAGYAGGIMSAGVDGILVAEAVGAALLAGPAHGKRTVGAP
ncbi:MAG: FAD-dependent oxidoreductase [Anaerolineae bacterium]